MEGGLNEIDAFRQWIISNGGQIDKVQCVGSTASGVRGLVCQEEI